MTILIVLIKIVTIITLFLITQSCFYTSYYYDQSLRKCTLCQSTCYTCVDQNSCTSCVPFGYYLNNYTKYCSTCPVGCVTCTSSNQCSFCYIGYYLNTSNNICHSCDPSCFNCFDSTPCQTNCYKNYYYLDTSSNLCVSCQSSCWTCTNSTSCASCYFIGHYLDPTTKLCKTCHYTCGNCTNSTPCSASLCYFYGQYTISGSSLCYICDPSCLTCDNYTMCTSCYISGHYFNTTTLTCQFCDVSCQTCVNSSSCTTCYPNLPYINSSSNLCTLCLNNSGYYRDNPNNLCRPCPKNCMNCNYLICSICKFGYNLDSSGNCIVTPSDGKNSNLILIIAVISASIATIGIVVILIYCFCFRPKVMNDIPAAQGQNNFNAHHISFDNVISNQQVTIQFKQQKCSICFQSNCDLITKCKHIFHKTCFKQWLAKQGVCPSCRKSNITIVDILLCDKCNYIQKDLYVFVESFFNDLKQKKQSHNCTNKTPKKIRIM